MAHVCTKCDGKGIVGNGDNPENVEGKIVTCDACQGTGRVAEEAAEAPVEAPKEVVIEPVTPAPDPVEEVKEEIVEEVKVEETPTE